jgi:PPP family 3-phenylpropionic acid transporter
MTLRPVLSPVRLRRSLSIVTWLFFLMYAGIGIFFTFFAVFLRSAGMSGTEIGLINMSGGISAFLASTLWGYWSDRSGKPRFLLAIASAGTAITALMFPFSHSFWSFLILGSIFPFFNVAIVTLMDSNLLALLGENRSDYGRYRLGGTFGYMLSSISVGFLFRENGIEIMFPLFAVIASIFALSALFLPDLAVERGKTNRSPRAILAMMRRPAWLIFAFSVFLAWIAGSGAISFLGVSLKNMGAEDALIGVVASSAALFEIPFMLFNSWFLRKIGSRRMLAFSLIGYVARSGLYSFIPSPAWAIAVNALNGVSYVWLWNASINYANDQAPEELKATAQGLFVSTTALAAVVSAPLAGWLFDSLGPPGMFRVMAGVALVAVFIFWFGERGHGLPRSEKLTSQTSEEI